MNRQPVEVWHGDSRNLTRSINETVHCIITDPPYGIDYKSGYAELPTGLKFVRDIEGDDDVDGAILLFMEVMTRLLPQLAEHADVYVFTHWSVLNIWILNVERLGLKVSNVLVWDKGNPGLGDIVGSYGNSHELIIYAKKGRRPVRDRRSSIISVDKVFPGKIVHPSEKPVDLMEVLIRQSTDIGELIVDPFAGSGSTAVAAQRLGRQCIAIEKDEMYVKYARERLSQVSLL